MAPALTPATPDQIRAIGAEAGFGSPVGGGGLGGGGGGGAGGHVASFVISRQHLRVGNPGTYSARVAVEAGIAQSWHKLVGDTGEIT